MTKQKFHLPSQRVCFFLVLDTIIFFLLVGSYYSFPLKAAVHQQYFSAPNQETNFIGVGKTQQGRRPFQQKTLSATLLTSRHHRSGIRTDQTTKLFMSQMGTEFVEDTGTSSIFNDENWDAYLNIMDEVLASRRVMRNQNPEDFKQAIDYLRSRQNLVTVPSIHSDSGKEFGEFLKAEQRDKFMEQYDFSSDQYQFVGRCLTYIGNMCANVTNFDPIPVAFFKMKEMGFIPRPDCLNTYMYALGGDERYMDTLVEAAAFHDLFYPPTENTIMSKIKYLVTTNAISEAEAALASLPDKGEVKGRLWKRLRTFLPLLQHHCDEGNAGAILRLFRNMRQSAGVIFDPDTYALIISSLAKFGYFRRDTSAVFEDGPDFGFTTSSGPKLFSTIAEEMADDLLDVPLSSIETIVDGFAQGFPSCTTVSTERLSDRPEEMEPLVISRVEINAKTGLCPLSDAQLRLLKLDDDQRQYVHDGLLRLASLTHQEFSKKQIADGKDDKDRAFRELSEFSQWLNSRDDEPFTAIVDGPNVAYFGSPRFNYRQLKLVVDELESMGEKPLITMPRRYTNQNLRLSNGYYQALSDEDLDILNGYIESEKIYLVPPRCLDDYYWMLGSVANQTNSKQLHQFESFVDGASGRISGLRPILVTNDQMRDHKLELLEPREFRRWCSCHIINYNITFIGDRGDDGSLLVDENGLRAGKREIELFPADIFSREIQGNPPKQQQEQQQQQQESDGLVWHIPVSEWENPSRLMIWLKE